ncbi:MAG: glycosyl transferase family 28 [Prevotella sp.]|nr:glycosyl transferase family 28 [Prevotella sp.]
MIFATIGTQAPFDRFIRTLDEIAVNLDEEIIAQTHNGIYEAQHLKTVGFLPPDVFNEYFKKARLIVAHAGMGTIISALTQNKPIIVMPRLASLGEHRNDHQMATAMRLDELGYIHVAYDKKQLEDLLLNKDIKPLKQIGESASQSLIDSLTEYINSK